MEDLAVLDRLIQNPDEISGPLLFGQGIFKVPENPGRKEKRSRSQQVPHLFPRFFQETGSWGRQYRQMLKDGLTGSWPVDSGTGRALEDRRAVLTAG